MRHSEFWRLMDEEFGAGFAQTLYRDHVLDGLRDVTASDAVAAGAPLRDVWFAMCDAMDVPEERRWGQQNRRR